MTDLSYVAMCIDLNEIILLLILLHENIQQDLKTKTKFCFTMLIRDHKCACLLNAIVQYTL